MINIKKKELCCGCTACMNICPKSCIQMKLDEEGFLYPRVNADLCIDCKVCEKVCPILNQQNSQSPINVYAAINPDEITRINSSSGGVFTLLAQQTIKAGGVVFGATFNNEWKVVHSFTETEDGLCSFRGSKYVQSDVNESFSKCKEFLLKGKQVLYTGTPCQISGLKKYLKREYDKLLTVDFVCHGVPSPKVWELYIKELLKNARHGENTVSPPLIPSLSECGALVDDKDVKIESISFRDKRLGWKKFSFALTLAEATADGKKNSVSLSQIFTEDIYMKAFLSNLTLRPSCYYCKFKECRSHSDITLADFWGVDKVAPNLDDDKGVSLALVNSNKGAQALPQNISYYKMSLKDVVQYNSAYRNSVAKHPRRKEFFKRIDEVDNIILLMQKCVNLTMWHKMYVIVRKIKDKTKRMAIKL